MKLLYILVLLVVTISNSFAIEVYREKNRHDGIVVYKTENKYEANIIVYITESKSEAGQKWFLWHYTTDRYSPKTQHIYFADSKYSADLIVYITKHKSEAKWIK